MNITMNKMGEKMFLKYFFFFLLILYKDIFYYHHQFKTNVIRLYDYFIIGGLLSCSHSGYMYRSLQVYQRSNTQVGQRVLSDFTPINVRPNCPTKLSDQIVRQMSDQILPGRSESLHSQIVKL